MSLKYKFLSIKCKRELLRYSNGLVTYKVTTPLGKYSYIFRDIDIEYFRYLNKLDDYQLMKLLYENQNVTQNY